MPECSLEEEGGEALAFVSGGDTSILKGGGERETPQWIVRRGDIIFVLPHSLPLSPKRELSEVLTTQAWDGEKEATNPSTLCFPPPVWGKSRSLCSMLPPRDRKNDFRVRWEKEISNIGFLL